jgi:hypothetical protein
MTNMTIISMDMFLCTPEEVMPRPATWNATGPDVAEVETFAEIIHIGCPSWLPNGLDALMLRNSLMNSILKILFRLVL